MHIKMHILFFWKQTLRLSSVNSQQYGNYVFGDYCYISKFPTKLSILKPLFTFAHGFLEFGKEFGKCSDLYCLGVLSGCSPVSAGADIIWGHWAGDPGWFMRKAWQLGGQLGWTERPDLHMTVSTGRESQQGRLALKQRSSVISHEAARVFRPCAEGQATLP